MDSIFQQSTCFFYDLTPDVIFNAVETFGVRCTGRMFTLNSMENRVYEVEIETERSQVKTPSERFRVVKFYRPGRWSQNQIQEEHRFLLDLKEADIEVICPVQDENGETVKKLADFDIYYTVFPKSGGRSPDELNFNQFETMGRSLARLHAVGRSRPSTRLQLNAKNFVDAPLKLLCDGKWIPKSLEHQYTKVLETFSERAKSEIPKWNAQRIHGDCHLRNIFWTERGPKFLDFDDMLVGPPIQDLWLVMPGRQIDFPGEWELLLEAYTSMNSFEHGSLKLIELLRGLRMIYYCAWIAKRWDDPFFKKAFPYFGSEAYWRNTLSDLVDQSRHIESPTQFPT